MSLCSLSSYSLPFRPHCCSLIAPSLPRYFFLFLSLPVYSLLSLFRLYFFAFRSLLAFSSFLLSLFLFRFFVCFLLVFLISSTYISFLFALSFSFFLHFLFASPLSLFFFSHLPSSPLRTFPPYFLFPLLFVLPSLPCSSPLFLSLPSPFFVSPYSPQLPCHVSFPCRPLGASGGVAGPIWRPEHSAGRSRLITIASLESNLLVAIYRL